MISLPQIEQEYGSGQRTFSLRVPSLSIELNSITYLIGPNGSGKSLFLNELFSRAVAGQLRDANGLTLRPILLGQSADASIANSLTVAENVALWARRSDWPSGLRPLSAVHEVIDAWEERLPSLAGIRSQLAQTLSGGQKQILNLLTRLQLEPALLLLDETLSAVDHYHSSILMSIIEDYLALGDRACIAVSHDLVAVGRQADRVVIFSDGNVAADLRREKALVGPEPVDLTEEILASWPMWSGADKVRAKERND